MEHRVVPRRYRRTALLLALAWPGVLAAQSVAAGDSALARGDTTAAIAAFEAAVAKDLHDAEAHYRAGMLYMTRHKPGAELSPPRQKAEEHFQYAIRFGPDSAKYYLGLAAAFRTETYGGPRSRVMGLLDKAAEVARTHPTPTNAAISYAAARERWPRYERFARHYLFSGDSALLDLSAAFADWLYVKRFVRDEMVRDPSDLADRARREAEADLRAALAGNPRFVGAAGLLIILMAEDDRWPEALDVGRTLVRAAPDSAGAWAVYGMVLARANRWREAQAAYDTALAHMTPAERQPYDNIGVLLSRPDQQRWADVPATDRPEFARQFLASAQPLYLTNLNEARTEFYARLTYVQWRWGDPARGRQGYDSDVGRVYLRWGEPDVWAKFGTGTNAVGSGLPDFALGNATPAAGMLENPKGDADWVLWVYWPTHLRFVFGFSPMFGATSLAGDFRALYREGENLSPVRFDNLPVERMLDTIDVQVAQFRADEPGRTDLVAFGLMPVGRMAAATAPVPVPMQTGVVIRDYAQREVVRQSQTRTIQGGDSTQIDRGTWRFSLRPDRYLMHVEAVSPGIERAARGASHLTVRSFAGDSLMLSDVLLADNVTPKDSAPARWSDFFIAPSAGRFTPGHSIGLLWEIYNLTPDARDVVRYHIELRIVVKDIERHGFGASILGGIGDAVGLSAKGDNAVALSYNREATATPTGLNLEYLTVNLQDAPNATYDLEMLVTDRETGRQVRETRHFTITPTPLTR